MKKILIILFIICFCHAMPASAETWWKKYNDPLLVGYINDAVNNNHDYKSAKLKIEESRARVREYLGKELPQLSMPGAYLRLRPPPFAADKIALEQRNALLALPGLANYEVDFWLKNRKTTRAQKEQLAMTEQDTKTVQIALMTDVASAYFNILQLDKLIELQNDIILADTENLNLANSEYDSGLMPFDAIVNAEYILVQSQTLLNNLYKDRDFFLNELMVLTGKAPVEGDKETLARSSIDNIVLPPDIPMEIPPNGVMQRPDILRVEANLREAKLNIDIAKTAFLPKVNVFGIFGFIADNISTIANIDEILSGFGTLFTPVFYTGGQRHAVLKQKKFIYEQLMETYQSTIKTALKEADNALYALKTDLENNECVVKQLQIQSDNLNLVNVRYTQGLSSRLETVQPQKSLLLTHQNQVRSKTGYLIDSINLYKALGGEM